MRGRRLCSFGATLCDDVCGDGASCASGALDSVGCAIHSSERSSSHGWLMFAVGGVPLRGEDARVVVDNCVDVEKTRGRRNYASACSFMCALGARMAAV